MAFVILHFILFHSHLLSCLLQFPDELSLPLGEIGGQLYIVGDDKVAKRTIPSVHTLALDPHLGPVLGLGLHLELDFRTVAEGNNHLATSQSGI